jgi:integrase/recombinase XerC
VESTGEYSERLTGGGIYHLVRWLGKQAGVKARPHGLRHAAVTAALDAFDGDYRKVKVFSRHKSLDIVQRYDDNRADHGGQVAAVLSAIVAE